MLDYRSFSAVREGGLQKFNVQGSFATFGEYKVDRHRQARGDVLALHQKCLTINWNNISWHKRTESMNWLVFIIVAAVVIFLFSRGGC
jgi:hypothetical protein